MAATLEQTRYERIAELAGDGCTAAVVEGYIEAYSDNSQHVWPHTWHEEHLAWFSSATNEKIAAWIARIRK